MTWRDNAACIGVDTEMFYAHEEINHPPSRDRVARHALNLCAACPVKDECLEAALNEPGKQHGIRGGTYAKRRSQIVELRRVPAA